LTRKTLTTKLDGMNSFRSPWQHEHLFPPARLRNGRFGLLQKEGVSEISLAGLVDAIRIEDSEDKDRLVVGLIEHPDRPRLVTRFDAPELRDMVLERIEADARKNLRRHGTISLILLPLLLAASIWMSGPIWLAWTYFVQSAETALGSLRLRRGLRRDPIALLQSLDARLRYDFWASRLPWTAAWRTWTLTLVLIALYAIQWMTGMEASVVKVALVKPAVAEGDWWRLLTAPLFHGPPLHIVFNVLSWISLGPVIERVTHRNLLLPVFLTSALGGSVASVLLLPHPSLGASGGILGLLGLLTAMGIRRKPMLPPGFLADLMPSLLNLAVLGILGWRFIDNAAHAGGYVTGLILGLLVFRKSEGPLPLPRQAPWAWIDGICQLLLAASVAWAVRCLLT